MMTYEKPTAEFIKFESEHVLSDLELPDIPSAPEEGFDPD